MSVPDDVKQLLVELRTYLQEKCEPPVYVSDRRLLKSVNLMKVGPPPTGSHPGQHTERTLFWCMSLTPCQSRKLFRSPQHAVSSTPRGRLERCWTVQLCLQVAAYTSGRSSVSPFDCLLLQHVLWQRPEEAVRIADYILSQLASDEKSLEQADYIFKGVPAPPNEQVLQSIEAPSRLPPLWDRTAASAVTITLSCCCQACLRGLARRPRQTSLRTCCWRRSGRCASCWWGS